MDSNKIIITQSYTLVSRTKTNSTNQNLPISMSDSIKKTKTQQWLKKHRGFGGKLNVQRFE